jgi:uncharacterized protein YjlB
MITLQYQFEDDGIIPNTVFPLIIYKKVFDAVENLDAIMEEAFSGNNWTNAWRNGIYPYHHYHSTSHEVVGVYKGSAELLLGGEKGKKVSVNAGDVIIIPAGTGHKKLSGSDDFAVLGAYPGGRDYDLLTGEEGERPKADERIAQVPVPETDPVLGYKGGIMEYWR